MDGGGYPSELAWWKGGVEQGPCLQERVGSCKASGLVGSSRGGGARVWGGSKGFGRGGANFARCVIFVVSNGGGLGSSKAGARGQGPWLQGRRASVPGG